MDCEEHINAATSGCATIRTITQSQSQSQTPISTPLCYSIESTSLPTIHPGISSSSGVSGVGIVDDNDKSPMSNYSPGSNSSSSTTSSAPQYSEDMRRTFPNALNLLARQGSQSSTKTCEVDLGDEERDTFSPISSSNTPSDGECCGAPLSSSGCCDGATAGTSVDNKVYDVSLPSSAAAVAAAAAAAAAVKIKLNNGQSGSSSAVHSTTKEEKQRQNEEIVIMETSSISSETGSWESVFPHTAVVVTTTNSTTTSAAAIAANAAVSSAINIPALRLETSRHGTTNTTTTTTTSTTKSNEISLRNCCMEFLHNERTEHQSKIEKLKDKGNVSHMADSNMGLLKDPCLPPYLRERTFSTGSNTTADTSSLFTGGSAATLLRDLEKRENALSTSGTSACFIDASSLRDEDEVLSFPSLEGQHLNDDLDENAKNVNSDHEQHHETMSDDRPKEDPDAELVADKNAIVDDDDSPTKKLATFHKSFAKCKTKPKHSTDISNSSKSSSNSSSTSGADSPQKDIERTSGNSLNNLSDEEKLWKRGHENKKKPKATELKDLNEKQPTSGNEDATEASVSLAADVDSSDSSEIVKLRREQERRQGSYVFHHQIQPSYTIHPLGVSPKFTTHPLTSNPTATATATAATTTSTTTTTSTVPNTHHTSHPIQSDLSYTTDYSSSSPAPSLIWSEHEHRPNANNVKPHTEDIDVNGLSKSCHLPDTPHNSIVHIDPNSSNTSSIHRDYTLSSSLSHQRDSGAYCSDATDSPIPMPRTPKRSKFDEANPIVSGGASIKDFNVKQCESPPVKRRTETCPIVSGGFVSLDFERAQPLADDDDANDENDDDDDEEEVELRVKSKARKPIPGIASWVVDMSDCRSERRKSTSSTSSIEAVGKFRERSDSTSSHKSGCGFYVSLDDMDKKPADVANATKIAVKSPMSKSYTAPKSTGFFVNLSKSEYQPKEIEVIAKEPKLNDDGNDKRNIFSMFIDFGDKKTGANAKREPVGLAQRFSSANTTTQRRTEDPMKSSASSTETLMSRSANLKAMIGDIDGGVETKSLDYRCNVDPPITVAAIRRLSQQQRAQNEATKRHSWGNSQTKDAFTHDYKRSISLTANGDSKENGSGNNGLMSIIDKLPLISKASSLSIESSLSPYDEYMGSKSDMSSISNNSARNSMSGGERDDDGINSATVVRMKKRRRDVQINETFDKSSLASITDGVLSKDLSPASTTDTEDLTFQQDEELAIRESVVLHQQQLPSMQIPSNRQSAIVMETIIEAKETSSPKKTATGHTMETLHATIEKQKMLLETVNEHGEAIKTNFVKLSDMDKPVKHELNSPEAVMSKSVGNHRQINRLFRDESKARPHSWTMTRSTGNSFLNITNSVENIRSLSRLFPHFSKEFSNSLPNDMILDQMDYIQTDLSTDSSLASSFSRSGMDESSISCRQPRRLGEDLLKMFLQEIATDMIVEVHGRRIKAHKCILRSRCQYFAAVLAGHSAQSVVSLQGYSYSAVHFALCHIYSGASHPPDGISLMELAALADLLGLEGLKEVTAHALKTNYCHNFHKPCSGCIDGILQVLPVALNHALDDLYRKCLRWTCRHYLKVWPTRQFSQLPPDILGRCRQQIVAYLTSETVLDAVLDCDNLLGQLASLRWGGLCENLVRDILDATYAYIADHFASLIASDSFLSLGHDRSCRIPELEGVLLRTASSLTPDQACRSYQRVTRLNTVLQAKIIQMPASLGDLAKELQGLQEEDLDWDPEYIRLVSAILSAVEQCLIRQCSRAMRVTAWQRMDLDLRKKIQSLARLTEPLDIKRGKPVSKAFSFGGNTRNQDLYQVKLAIQAHSKRALAQDTQLYKATQTHDIGNVQTTERGVQANDMKEASSSKILKSNSRAHVPQSFKSITQSATLAERNNINTHRRTQSEVPVSFNKPNIAAQQPQQYNETKQEQTKPKLQPRLADVRPRYLEPRKTRTAPINGTTGPVRSATSSSIPSSKLKGHHLSSSDSSRNSSPATRKTPATVKKVTTKSTHMSLDSLASPSRRARNLRGKSSDGDRFSDIGVDSMAESMKSSVITNKTISQESLTNASKLSRSNPLIGTNLKIASNRNQVQLNNNRSKQPHKFSTAVGGARTAKHLQSQNITSTGSSPSSVTTTKSATSRLSSVSSTHSSRDLYKNRSISVPGHVVGSTSAAGQPTVGTQQRHSFLSAKSREILAKRAEKNKLQQQQQQQNHHQQQQQPQQLEPQIQQINNNHSSDETKSKRNTTGPLRSASHTAITAANYNNRNSLPSNIPTRRPNTLQLKKTTNGLNMKNTQNIYNNYGGGGVGNVGTTIMQTNAKNKIANATNGVLKSAAHAVKQKIDLLIDNTAPFVGDKQHTTTLPIVEDITPLRVETKLERSSTFCKETSDIDLNELQIIE